MKIVAISDTHDQHHKITIPECDILIHAGDATCHRQFRESLYISFVEWFKNQPAKHKIFIAGNHDTMWEANYWQYHKQEAIKEYVKPAIYLQDSGTEIEGLKLWGTPWTPVWDSWAFQDHDERLKYVWYEIPDGVDILIVHGPPRNINDIGVEHSNIGSITLLDHLERMALPPKIVIHGHVHNKGTTFTPKIKYYNVAMCQGIVGNNNNLVNEPTIIEL